MITENILRDKSRAKVLVIDDCSDSRKLISTILNGFKCEVTFAVDGKESVPLLAENEYDLIVIDWHMPEMGGSETLMTVDRVFTEKAELKKIGMPFVIYSSIPADKLHLPKINNLSFLGTFHKSETMKTLSKKFGQILQVI